MADALVSTILQQITTIFTEQVRHEVKLVVGVEREIKFLEDHFNAIRAVLEDAERKQLKNDADSDAIKQWLTKLKDLSYDMDDVLDEWSTAILKWEIKKEYRSDRVSILYSLRSCFPWVARRRDIAHKIKEISESLEVIDKDRARFSFVPQRVSEGTERAKTTSFFEVSNVHGRVDEKEKVISYLLCESSQEGRQVHVISISGMGGIGKTTLAQLAYNHDEIKAQFEKRIWVCVSDPFDEKRVAKAIIEDLTGATPNLQELQPLCRRISECLQGKKFLLVLDDVWDDNPKKWEPLKESLKCGAPGSRILVTTRKDTVVKMMETTYWLQLGRLSDEESWSFFSQVAFRGRSDHDCAKFKDIGRQIVDRCKGLPLAVKTLAGLMQSKQSEEEWENVLSNELWEIKEVEKDLFPALFLSYYDLPVAIRSCFTYCAMFPKDHVMERGKLVKMWMAQGYLKASPSQEIELVGKEYFEILAMRAFFQDFQEMEEDSIKFKMHDVVHDFAQFLMKDEYFTVDTDALKRKDNEFLYQRARHAIITVSNWERLPDSIYNARKLRSLSIRSSNDTSIGEPLVKLLRNLMYLRLFDLGVSPVEAIPSEVGRLIHLRYLNFSHCEYLKVLPETISDLYNLQSLDVTWCVAINKLPRKIRKLIRLRHLQIFGSGVAFMPKGIEKLRSLRTLTNFILNGGDESDASNLGELENLSQLRGTLWIEKLRNVGDVNEAMKANIKNKKYLNGLYLLFNGEKTESPVDENALLKALQPPPELEVLSISEYTGTLIPNWMMSLTRMRRLEVSSRGSFEVLPPLGRLPYLEKLTIGFKTRKLDVAFLGIETDEDANEAISMKGGGERAPVTAFPKLREFCIWKMEELEEWDGIGSMTGEKDAAAIIMPELRELEVRHCPKLKALPDYILIIPLGKLKINECPILQDQYQEEMGQAWHKISHVSEVEINYVKRKRPQQNP